jgi:hypothetical protein
MLEMLSGLPHRKLGLQKLRWLVGQTVEEPIPNYMFRFHQKRELVRFVPLDR